jgi:hypothetical protein
MRLIESFDRWLLWSELNESAQARDYILRRAATGLNKGVESLTAEERSEALKDSAFTEIVDAAKNYPKYAAALVRFHYEQRIPIDEILGFIDRLSTDEAFLKQIENNIDYYASVKGQQNSGWEQLNDAISTVKEAKRAKWLVDSLPNPLRSRARAGKPEEKKELIRAAISFEELGEEIKRRYLAKIKSMADWPLARFLNNLSGFLAGYNNANMTKRLEEVAKLEPEVGILYLDERYLAIGVRTEAAQKALCSMANWCINRGAWANYGGGEAIQVNIFDSGVAPSDPLYLVGTTIKYNGQSKTTHDINDAYIQKSSDPKENLLGIGYPEKLVTEVVDLIDTEISIKRLVAQLGIDKKKPSEVLRSIINEGYVIDPKMQEQAIQIIFEIIDTRLREQGFTKKDVIAAFAEKGVLSKISAIVFNKYANDLTPTEKLRIYSASIAYYDKVNQMVSTIPSLAETKVIKTVLSQRDDVETVLGVNFNDYRR